MASGLSSPTQLGTRIYQAHLVYTLCLAHLCLSGAPEDDVNGDPFLSFEGVRFSTHLRKVLVAPTVPMEDQDSEEYCEAAALAAEMMTSRFQACVLSMHTSVCLPFTGINSQSFLSPLSNFLYSFSMLLC
jgi:hypothetical protein